MALVPHWKAYVYATNSNNDTDRAEALQRSSHLRDTSKSPALDLDSYLLRAADNALVLPT